MQKLDSIGRLAGGIAHDFNNILLVMNGCVSQLSAGPMTTSDCCGEALRELEHSTERAAGLTRQLLMFSRKQVMQMGSLNISETILNISKMFGRIIGEDIDLELRCDKQVPHVRADAGMIEQVLMNLVVNSRDAMPGGGRLTLSTAVVETDKEIRFRNPEARPGRFVRVSVADTGVGIPANVLEHIFEPFFTTKRKGEGTGLGLPTVYGIIRQHEGWIDVDSRVGTGTVFHVFLPVSRKCLAKQSDVRVSGSKVSNGQATVLLVEDDQSVGNILITVLKRYGYTGLYADTAAKALKIWKEHSKEIDVLLTDMVMPGGMSGRQLGEVLKDEKQSLKVILVSGYSPDPTIGEWIQASGTTFLEKPYTPTLLTEKIRDFLSR